MECAERIPPRWLEKLDSAQDLPGRADCTSAIEDNTQTFRSVRIGHHAAVRGTAEESEASLLIARELSGTVTIHASTTCLQKSLQSLEEHLV